MRTPASGPAIVLSSKRFFCGHHSCAGRGETWPKPGTVFRYNAPIDPEMSGVSLRTPYVNGGKPMRDVTKRLKLRTVGAALLAGSLVLAVSAGAEARDDRWDHRDHHRDHHRWHHKHDRHERFVERHRYIAERPVYVRERPVVVERPVMMAPMMPMYQPPYQQGPSGLNLNFNIPLN
jgi:hypothetical protein